MAKILTFFLALVLLSYYIANTVIFLPLDLFKGLESVFGYVFIGLGVSLIIWLMGD